MMVSICKYGCTPGRLFCCRFRSDYINRKIRLQRTRISFRLWRHRTANDWTELRSKSRFVDRWRKQYLTRHAFDLWYLDMLKTVSRRAVRVLLFVRHWQRRDWDKWVARFCYRTLAARFLRYWRDCPPGLIASSDEDVPVVRARVSSSSESDSSGDVVRTFEIVAAVRLRRHRFVRSWSR